MSFEEFQNRARLYVIGALDADEVDGFEAARREFGTSAEECINECYSLHEAFALSLQPARASDSIKDRLMARVRQKKTATATVEDGA